MIQNKKMLEFKRPKKKNIERSKRRWFFSRNAPSQWQSVLFLGAVFSDTPVPTLPDVTTKTGLPTVDWISRRLEIKIKAKTNPNVVIHIKIKPKATCCLVRFALNM